MSGLRLQGIDHVALAVRDVHRSAGWYRDVPGLEITAREVGALANAQRADRSAIRPPKNRGGLL